LIAASQLRRIAPLAGADQPPVALLGVADGVPLEIGMAVAELIGEAGVVVAVAGVQVAAEPLAMPPCNRSTVRS
jgi:hypothetical protein